MLNGRVEAPNAFVEASAIVTTSTRLQSDAGVHGHRIHPANMLRAGLAEMVGTSS